MDRTIFAQNQAIWPVLHARAHVASGPHRSVQRTA